MPKTILLIDDDALILQSIGLLLRKRGYQVETASDGYEALEKIDTGEFDLIICDIRMPGIDGIETLKRIRDKIIKGKHNKSAEIFLTGYAEEALEKKARDMKIAKFFYKPFEIKEFLEVIEKAIPS